MPIQWEGVMPAMTTPFTADDQIDMDLFHQNLHAQCEAGVHGVILGGSLGEASTLSDAEKDLLIREASREVGDRVPVICNIAEQSTRQAIAAAHRAEKEGAHGLMILPPMRYKATDHEVCTFFKAITSETDLPVMIYNNPVDYQILVDLDMFEDLLEFDQIQAVKESTRDVSNITRIRNRFGERLKILCGVDTLALESLLMGANGWVAGLVCAFPEETVAVYRLARAGKIIEARQLYQWFLPLLELDISPQLVQNIKMAQQATGLGTEYVRAPRLPLQGAERRRVSKIIEDSLAQRPELSTFGAMEMN